MPSNARSRRMKLKLCRLDYVGVFVSNLENLGMIIKFTLYHSWRRTVGIYIIFDILISFQNVYENRGIVNILHLRDKGGLIKGCIIFENIPSYSIWRPFCFSIIHRIFSYACTFGRAYSDLRLHSISCQGDSGQITRK